MPMTMFAEDVVSGVTTGQAMLAAATTSAVGLFTVFGSRLQRLMERVFDRWENPPPPRIQQATGFRDILKSHDIMQAIEDLPFVNRVLMMEGANGGGLPRAGKAYNARCIGVVPQNMQQIRRLYEGPLLVDKPYLQMLITLVEKGIAIATRGELPAQSILGVLYAEEGVFEAALFWLASDEKTTSFLSVANYERKFTEGEIARINSYVVQLRGLMGSTLVIPDTDSPK